MKENVNHPIHYNSHPSGIECIDIVRHHNFNIGNAIKYLWRHGLKEENNAIDDLKKAIFYINDEILRINKESDSKNNNKPKYDIGSVEHNILKEQDLINNKSEYKS